MTLTERIQTYLDTYADHLGRKVTKSSPLTLQTARKRLYFSDFKERLVHFNGTVVKVDKKTYTIVCEVIDNEPTLTPSYMESLKMKILKKLAK